MIFGLFDTVLGGVKWRAFNYDHVPQLKRQNQAPVSDAVTHLSVCVCHWWAITFLTGPAFPKKRENKVSKKPTLPKPQVFIVKYLLIFSPMSESLGENQTKFAEIFGSLENFKEKSW